MSGLAEAKPVSPPPHDRHAARVDTYIDLSLSASPGLPHDAIARRCRGAPTRDARPLPPSFFPRPEATQQRRPPRGGEGAQAGAAEGDGGDDDAEGASRATVASRAKALFTRARAHRELGEITEVCRA